MGIPLQTIEVLSCEGCGKCCEHVGTPPGFYAAYCSDKWDGVYLTNTDDYSIWLSMPQSLRDNIANWYNMPETFQRYDKSLPCFWYDEVAKKCKNYDYRPIVCREFEMGGDDCVAFRNTN